jgi:hypothetical protein
MWSPACRRRGGAIFVPIFGVTLFSRSYQFSFELDAVRVRFALVFVASPVPVRRAVIVSVAPVFQLLPGVPPSGPVGGGYFAGSSALPPTRRTRMECDLAA